jgi:hypothetical protein
MGLLSFPLFPSYRRLGLHCVCRWILLLFEWYVLLLIPSDSFFLLKGIRRCFKVCILPGS